MVRELKLALVLVMGIPRKSMVSPGAKFEIKPLNNCGLSKMREQLLEPFK